MDRASSLTQRVTAVGVKIRLVDLANRLAEKAIKTGRPVPVEPMSPHDRRIVHVTLAEHPGVTTESDGEGLFRRVVIYPKDRPAAGA